MIIAGISSCIMNTVVTPDQLHSAKHPPRAGVGRGGRSKSSSSVVCGLLARGCGCLFSFEADTILTCKRM